MKRWISLCCLLAALALAGAVDAARWESVRWSDDAKSRMEFYQPSDSGHYPALVWIQSSSSAPSAADLPVLRPGQVLVLLRIADEQRPVSLQLRELAAALAYLRANATRYSIDPSRISLGAAGSRAPFAALLATQTTWLGQHEMTPSMLQALVLMEPIGLDLQSQMLSKANEADYRTQLNIWGSDVTAWNRWSALQQIAANAGSPPLLILTRADASTAQRRQRERFTDRWRAAGFSSQILPIADAPQRDVDNALELTGTDIDRLYSWLDSVALPRLPRFEQLGFKADFVSGLRDGEVSLRGAEVAFLIPQQRRLIASLSNADPQSTEPARLLVKTEAQGDWKTLHAFNEAGARFTHLFAGQFLRASSAQPMAEPMPFLLTGLASAQGARWYWSAHGSELQRVDAHPDTELQSALVHRDHLSGRDLLLLGTRGGGVRSMLWDAENRSPILTGRSELEGADVVALVEANGQVFASVGGKVPAIYQRHDGDAPVWIRVAEWSSNELGRIAAMTAVADPTGSGNDVLLLAFSGSGQILRLDPMHGFRRSLELDLGAGFAQIWGSAPARVDFGSNAWVTLLHPETADAVQAIGLHLQHPDAQSQPHNGAWYLLRQQDGSYSYGLSYDFDNPLPSGSGLQSVRSIAVSPFAEDQGNAFYFGGFDAETKDRDSAWIHRAKLPSAGIQRGLWWDRTRPGHGIDLQPIGKDWLLTFSTYDVKGQPVWYSALGSVVNQQFVARDGLKRFRYALDATPPQSLDEHHRGDVRIKFGGDAFSGACVGSASKRESARALAQLSWTLDGVSGQWCIEPMQFGESGTPVTDGSGLWYAGATDTGWGVSITEHGVDGRGLSVAYVYYYDADGQPRWALGTAPVVQGNARYPLLAFSGYCPGCQPTEIENHRVGSFARKLKGGCAAVRGTGSLDIGTSDLDPDRFVRAPFDMQRISSAACY